jgi:hypothetical protein
MSAIDRRPEDSPIHTTRIRLICVIAITGLIGCGAPTPASVTNVTIDGGDRTVEVGGALTLTATVTATGNATRTITWGSSNTDVATINPVGVVTNLSAGNTIITATSTSDPTKSDSISLTVVDSGSGHGWTRQFGTSTDDEVNGVATDANGNVYVAGSTSGALEEGSDSGSTNAFIRSYDGDGNHRWTRQFGTSGFDLALGIAADANGNVYAAGFTTGALEGSNLGDNDAFIRSYDSNGNHRWTRQFGTSAYDVVNGIATDAAGNVYVGGDTYGAFVGDQLGDSDAFVRSYDNNGQLRWTRQFGTSAYDEVNGIATDADGNVYVTGSTGGALDGTFAGGRDAFVRSYDNNGDHRWTRQFGTSAPNVSFAIATDANGNVFAAGYTMSALEGVHAGDNDAFIRSYDSVGAHRWTVQFGTSEDDMALGVATDANGHVFATGYTRGTLDGATSAGGFDAYLRSYDGEGDLRWTRQFGTVSIDQAQAVATDVTGNVYAVGRTNGALEGTNLGDYDAFIRKYGP